MNGLSHQRKRVIAIIATLVAVVGYWPNTSRLVAKTSAGGAQDSQSWASTAEPGDFNECDPGLILRPIDNLREKADDGLHITLRRTPQLDNFPDAKAAFLR